MATWLESMLAELKGVSDTQTSFAEPEEELGPKDHRVGVADEDLRKLFFLVKQYRKRMLEIVATLVLCRPKEREGLIKEAQRFNTQADTLKSVFWVSARVAFPELWDKPSIGVRKGWDVVWSDPEEHPSGILDTIFGDGGVFEEIFRRGSTGDTDDKKATDGNKSHLH